MAGVTAIAQLTTLVDVINAKAIMTMMDYGVFPGVFDIQRVPKGARSYYENKISALTAYALTEGVDMDQAQQMADTPITISPTEYGVQVVLTRLMLETRSENIETLAAKAITDALKKKQDTTGTEQMDNFATSLGSGSSTTLTRGYMGAALARIRGNTTELSNEPVSMVVHPYTYNDLVDAISDYVSVGTDAGPVYVGQAGAPEEFARQYVVGRFAGMPILTDANIAIASNAAKGGIFTKRSVVYAELWGVEIKPDDDPSLRGTELNGTMCFAYGERTDTHGVELNLGATAPTA